MSAPRDAVETAELIRTWALSPVEAVEEAFAAVAAHDAEVNAFTFLREEEARAEAREAERALADGSELGPLHGVPVSVKDFIWLRGAPATFGTQAYRDFVPEADAVCVRRLRDAGAVVVGKTNNPELCLDGFTENALYGVTRNPWDLSRTPGGSSGGAGASVAYGGPPIALGSDGGGSIRIPSAFCGVAGLKPTYGLVPKKPGFREWESLTVFGPLARSVRDLALALDVMAGVDPEDTAAVPAGGEDSDPVTLRIAYSADLGFAPVDRGVRARFEEAVGRLGEAGWRLEERHPDTDDPADLWGTIAVCEAHAAAAELSGQLGPRAQGFVDAGAGFSAKDYLDALEERAAYTRGWLAFFEEYDLLLTPAMQMTAFAVGLVMPPEIDGQPVDPVRENWCAFTYPANLTGQPAASVPCGLDEQGLPVGLQILGRRFEDTTVLRAAAAWEELAPWPSPPA